MKYLNMIKKDYGIILINCLNYDQKDYRNALIKFSDYHTESCNASTREIREQNTRLKEIIKSMFYFADNGYQP